MFLFYGNQLGNRLVKNLAAWTARKRGVNGLTRNHDWNIGRAFWRGLLGNSWLGIRFEVRCIIRRFVSVLKLGFGLVNLEGVTSEISSIRNFRANHLGSNLHPGAEA